MVDSKELKKTGIFCLAALFLAVAAMTFDSGGVTPEIFSDQGYPFYPNFTDPQAPKAIEVVDYDETTATTRPLKVEFRDSKWSIPSHYSYPADAADRLANTAAALMELRKDAIISDRAEDHGVYGVVDPLDPAATSFTGRGKRVTLRNENGDVLADFVVGKQVEDKPGYRYLRVPNQRRTYAVQTEADVSAQFIDWIETDLLKLSVGYIRRIAINSYSIDEAVGRIENVERLTLVKEEDKWALTGGGEPNDDKMRALTGALADLRIVDVQPKPPNLTRDLKTAEGIQLSMDTVMSLRQKGFFVVPNGQLFSNEGEVIVDTANGLRYTLRFGEIASGGPAPTGEAGDESAESSEDSGETEERRYLFITVDYDETRARQYSDGEGTGEENAAGEELATELQNRFADWYYVITGTDFNNLRPRRQDLLRSTPEANPVASSQSASRESVSRLTESQSALCA